MKKYVFGMLFVLTLGFKVQAAQSCASTVLTPHDLNGWTPSPHAASVESANAGTVKTIPVTDGASWCQASVRCTNSGRWRLLNVDCNQNPYYCPSKTFTVYDLGGWDPIGGSYSTNNGQNGQRERFCARASDGRTCKVVVRCNAGVWSPDWSTSACPNHCR